MHLIIADALLPAEFSAEVLRDLHLPGLETWARHARLLQRTDETTDLQRTTPAVRALLNACDIAASPEQAPSAALLMLADGLDPGAEVWHLLTAAHYGLARDHVTLVGVNPALDSVLEEKLWQQAHEVFETAGARLVPGQARRWYLQHPALNDLQGSDASRAFGRNVELWMPSGDEAAARLWRRWHTEIQMLWHEQPANGLWLSGSGALPLAPAPALKKSLAPHKHPLLQGLSRYLNLPLLESGAQADLIFLDDLSSHATQQDWYSWRTALQHLERDWFAPLAQSCRAFNVTLCGEFAAHTWRVQLAQSWKFWRRRSAAQWLAL